MKFKDLIKRHSTQSIIKMIYELYPKQRSTLASYRRIIQTIKNTKVKNPDKTIFVENAEIDGETFFDCYFTKGKTKRFNTETIKYLGRSVSSDGMFHSKIKITLNKIDKYSVINITPNKIGSYKVDSTSVETMGEITFIVAVLYNMTWFYKKI